MLQAERAWRFELAGECGRLRVVAVRRGSTLKQQPLCSFRGHISNWPRPSKSEPVLMLNHTKCPYNIKTSYNTAIQKALLPYPLPLAFSCPDHRDRDCRQFMRGDAQSAKRSAVAAVRTGCRLCTSPVNVGHGRSGCCALVLNTASRRSTKLPLCPGT
jgi:hypothetical protein